MQNTDTKTTSKAPAPPTSAPQDAQPQGYVNFYGRRYARPLRGARQNALETVLPQIKVDITAPLDPLSLFSFAPEAMVLEIGFGNGDSLARWHKDQPDTAFIGCEPFMNGVSALCRSIEGDDLSNIRVHPDMAEALLDVLTPRSLDRIYLLNPDPWHKKRHHKRRFIQQERLTRFAALLKPGGLLLMTSDDENIAQWMYEQAMEHPSFDWQGRTEEDRFTAPDGWRTTRYEQKGAKAGRRQQYLAFTNNTK